MKGIYTLLGQLLTTGALLAVMAGAAWAMDLGQAKTQGLVGETHTGYLAAVNQSAAVEALVVDINGKRKRHYQTIATQNSISLRAVEARAGLKAIAKTPPGQYVNTGSGWQKK